MNSEKTNHLISFKPNKSDKKHFFIEWPHWSKRHRNFFILHSFIERSGFIVSIAFRYVERRDEGVAPYNLMRYV